MIKKLILRFYNRGIESACTRTLYFFNTVDTYFMIVGVLSFLMYGTKGCTPAFFLAMTLAVLAVFKMADFSLLFLILSPIFLFFLFKSSAFSVAEVVNILLINLGLFLLIQFLFMSVPDSIVSRDPTIGIRKIWNSIFTIAQTTVSLPISVFFSTLYTLILVVRPSPLNAAGVAFWLSILVVSFLAYLFRPRSFCSSDKRPEIAGKLFERVIVLNIDGCRLDRFYEAKLPFLTSLQKESTYFPEGIQTVYRALTNPAFASILTGATPEVHGITSNNFGQVIKVEALPDVVKTKLYGSMHIEHFSKTTWDTRIVSLPTHGIYKSDDIMLEEMKEDLLKQDNTRLFIADISEVDFLGHAYGSESGQYLEALKRADSRLGNFFVWLKEKNLSEGSAVIVCSDHGIKRIDHSYLLFKAERYVPFIVNGKGIKRDNPLTFAASIMDIAPTVSYLLGVRYPSHCRGRVFVEALV